VSNEEKPLPKAGNPLKAGKNDPPPLFLLPLGPRLAPKKSSKGSSTKQKTIFKTSVLPSNRGIWTMTLITCFSLVSPELARQLEQVIAVGAFQLK